LNNSTNEEISRNFGKQFDIERQLRNSIFEIFFNNKDGYTLANHNYMMYNDNGKFSIIKFDFENTWRDDDRWENIKILEWGNKVSNFTNTYSPFTSRMIFNFKNRFIELWKMFLPLIRNNDTPFFRMIKNLETFLIPQIRYLFYIE
jgi:hypothetical protein